MLCMCIIRADTGELFTVINSYVNKIRNESYPSRRNQQIINLPLVVPILPHAPEKAVSLCVGLLELPSKLNPKLSDTVGLVVAILG